jgi:hypothetical protein
MLSSVQSLFSAWPGHNNTAEALNQAMSAMTQAFGQFTQASATTFAPPEKTPEAASSNGAAGTRRRSTR